MEDLENVTEAGVQITGKTMKMIQALKEKSLKKRTTAEALEDCVAVCLEYFEEIKANVLIDAKYGKKPYDCSKLHAMAQDKDMLCPHCGEPFNPNF